MARIDSAFPLGTSFIELESKKDGSFLGSALLLPLFYEKAMKRKTFTFREECIKNFIAESVCRMLSLPLERQPSADVVKVKHETALRC